MIYVSFNASGLKGTQNARSDAARVAAAPRRIWVAPETVAAVVVVHVVPVSYSQIAMSSVSFGFLPPCGANL